MQLYPAIDLRAGRCVRLLRGDYEQETVYGDDPVAQARTFAEAGASWLHVVDLDAARSGTPEHLDVVRAISDSVPIRLQVGGGVRDDAAAAALSDAGAARVVVGTAAIEDPAFLQRLAARQPVAVGLDVRGREVAVRGWQEGTGTPIGEALEQIGTPDAHAVVVTQIDQDGTLDGPDVGLLQDVLGTTALPVIASGGVGTLDHLSALADLAVGGTRLEGVIVGRALYEGSFSVDDALAATRS